MSKARMGLLGLTTVALLAGVSASPAMAKHHKKGYVGKSVSQSSKGGNAKGGNGGKSGNGGSSGTVVCNFGGSTQLLPLFSPAGCSSGNGGASGAGGAGGAATGGAGGANTNTQTSTSTDNSQDVDL
jgi:hypothetical protein